MGSTLRSNGPSHVRGGLRKTQLGVVAYIHRQRLQLPKMKIIRNLTRTTWMDQRGLSSMTSSKGVCCE